MTRRFFIGGALASGALAGCRGFWCPYDGQSAYAPKLRFGVVSDVHILGSIAAPEEFCELRGDTKIFEETLRWFRSRNVNAVMVVGDLADYGMVEELEAVAAAWDRVFPSNRLCSDYVEKLFTSGNHEINGFLYDDYAKMKFPEMTERRRHVLRADFARHWKRILKEPYKHFFRKEVKGYTFLSTHWGDDSDMSVGWCKNHFGVELQSYLDANGARLDPRKPFFYFQHPHLKDTCFGPWAWGHDDGKATAALSKYRQAVAFSGHAHYPLTDERGIWQGEFTSIGTASLRFAEMPLAARAPFGYENSDGINPKGTDYSELKTTPHHPKGMSPQGMLVSVYDDRMVVSRHEFPSGASLGDDWVMPLDDDRPFAFVERSRKARAPQFAAGAKLTMKATKAKTRGKSPKLVPAMEFVFPAAIAEPSARPFEYEIQVEGEKGDTAIFRLLARGFNRPRGNAIAYSDNVFTVPLSRFPRRVVRATVTPMDCWWNRGKAISTL